MGAAIQLVGCCILVTAGSGARVYPVCCVVASIGTCCCPVRSCSGFPADSYMWGFVFGPSFKVWLFVSLPVCLSSCYVVV